MSCGQANEPMALAPAVVCRAVNLVELMDSGVDEVGTRLPGRRGSITTISSARDYLCLGNGGILATRRLGGSGAKGQW